MSDTQLEAAQAHLAGIQLQLLDEILPAAAFLRQLEEFRTSVSPFSCLQISGSPHHQLLPTIIPNPLGFDCVDSSVSQSEPPSCLLRLLKKKKAIMGTPKILSLKLWDGTSLTWGWCHSGHVFYTQVWSTKQLICRSYGSLVIVRNHMHIAAHLTCFAGSLSRQPLIQGILPLYTDTCTLTHTKKPGLSHRWAVQSIPVWFY